MGSNETQDGGDWGLDRYRMIPVRLNTYRASYESISEFHVVVSYLVYKKLDSFSSAQCAAMNRK
jgi:hypothetical protein